MDATAQVAKRSKMIETKKWDEIREKQRVASQKRKRLLSPATNNHPEKMFSASSSYSSPTLIQEASQSGERWGSDDAIGNLHAIDSVDPIIADTFDASIEDWLHLGTSDFHTTSPGQILSFSPLMTTGYLIPPSHGIQPDLVHLGHEGDYLSYFRDCVSKTVHESLVENAFALFAIPGLGNAVLAISASERFHSTSVLGQGHDGAVNKLLSEGHLGIAQDYYNETIRALSGPTVESGSSIVERLTAILLCLIIEHRIGSPRGFISHLTSADALVLEQHSKISESTSGRKLLGTWSHLRALLKLNRLPFRPAEEERIMQKSRLCHSLEQTYCDGSSGAIQAILAGAYTLRRRIVMQSYMDSKDALKWYTLKSGHAYIKEEEIQDDMMELDIKQMTRLIKQQQKELDEWHEKLDPAELPREKATSGTINGTSTSRQSIVVRPFYFSTPRGAINYLSYALAQLLCLDEPLHHSNDPAGCFINQWAHMALRVLQSMELAALTPGNLSISFGIVISILVGSNASLVMTNYLLSDFFPQLKAKTSEATLLAEIASARRLVALYEDELLAGRTPLMVTFLHSVDIRVITSGTNEPLQAAIHGATADGTYSKCVAVPSWSRY